MFLDFYFEIIKALERRDKLESERLKQETWPEMKDKQAKDNAKHWAYLDKHEQP